MAELNSFSVAEAQLTRKEEDYCLVWFTISLLIFLFIIISCCRGFHFIFSFTFNLKNVKTELYTFMMSWVRCDVRRYAFSSVSNTKYRGSNNSNQLATKSLNSSILICELKQLHWNIYNFEKYLYFMISSRVFTFTDWWLMSPSWLGWIATADGLLTFNINNIEIAKIYIDSVYDFRIVTLRIRLFSSEIHGNSMMYWFWLFT